MSMTHCFEIKTSFYTRDPLCKVVWQKDNVVFLFNRLMQHLMNGVVAASIT